MKGSKLGQILRADKTGFCRLGHIFTELITLLHFMYVFMYYSSVLQFGKQNTMIIILFINILQTNDVNVDEAVSTGTILGDHRNSWKH